MSRERARRSHSKSRRAGSSAAQGTPVPPLGTSVRPGPSAELDRYIGYRKPYPQAHDDLDADTALQEEVRNDARILL